MIEAIKKRIFRFPTQLFLVVIGALLFIPFLGNVHLFDWDEINFAESAREMLLTHNYHIVQINFQPFYEKPPLFIWLQAISMHFLGVNEYAVRLPDASCGIATMLVVFNVGRYVFKSQLGTLWALLFACSVLPQVYFKSGIIDPVFNLFIFLGIFFMYRITIENDFEDRKTKRRNRRRNLILSALFIGLATLTKGPVAILIATLTATTYFFANRGKLKIEITELFYWLLIIAGIIGIWLSLDVRANGIAFIHEFIQYQVRLFKTEDAGHGGPFYYHFVILFFGVFPASALIFSAFRKNIHDDQAQNTFKKWMIYLLIVVLIIFTIVRTKIIHYSSLCYFPITFLAAYYLNFLFDGVLLWRWKQTVPLLGICLLIVGVFTGGVFLIQSPELFIPYLNDDFAKECLKAKVFWSDWDIRFGIVYLVCVIISVLFMQTKQVKWGTYILLISSALFVNTVMIFVVPRVEKYSQDALIEFMESKKNEPCIIETAGFKSYAQYFYPQKPLPSPADSLKTHYIVAKVTSAAELHSARPDLKELYRKNGWVFYLEKK